MCTQNTNCSGQAKVTITQQHVSENKLYTNVLHVYTAYMCVCDVLEYTHNNMDDRERGSQEKMRLYIDA